MAKYNEHHAYWRCSPEDLASLQPYERTLYEELVQSLITFESLANRAVRYDWPSAPDLWATRESLRHALRTQSNAILGRDDAPNTVTGAR